MYVVRKYKLCGRIQAANLPPLASVALAISVLVTYSGLQVLPTPLSSLLTQCVTFLSLLTVFCLQICNLLRQHSVSLCVWTMPWELFSSEDREKTLVGKLRCHSDLEIRCVIGTTNWVLWCETWWNQLTLCKLGCFSKSGAAVKFQHLISESTSALFFTRAGAPTPQKDSQG